ncbi:unnamed protein product [Closterium sp. Naga37s-1]|nr:unnamed protein product [Closterium sp. Naga37s-1]
MSNVYPQEIRISRYALASFRHLHIPSCHSPLPFSFQTYLDYIHIRKEEGGRTRNKGAALRSQSQPLAASGDADDANFDAAYFSPEQTVSAAKAGIIASITAEPPSLLACANLNPLYMPMPSIHVPPLFPHQQQHDTAAEGGAVLCPAARPFPPPTNNQFPPQFGLSPSPPKPTQDDCVLARSGMVLVFGEVHPDALPLFP